MRLYLVSIFSLLLIIVVSCNQINKPPNIPEKLKKYIAQTEYPVEYKKVNFDYGTEEIHIPGFITKKEALEDIELFEYLIKTSYSGYEYWKYQGADFDLYFSELKAFAEKRDTIFTVDFEREWSNILNFIQDGHIGLQGKNYFGAYKHKSVYFCEIVVEKTEEGEFKVINSQFEKIQTGDVFTEKNIEKYLFKTLSPPRKNHFLIGSFSKYPINSKNLFFNNKSIEIPFYENRLAFAKNNPFGYFKIDTINGIPVVNVSSFTDEIYPEMKQFMESGLQLKNENYIITNVMNNHGGSSLFPQTFISNLNGTVNWKTTWAELYSPPIVEYFSGYDLQSKASHSPGFKQMILNHREQLKSFQASPVKKWKFSANSDYSQKGNYPGTLIVLANRHVHSAGEAFVGSSASVEKRILIGENTAGSGMFSSTCDYILPNSKFIARLPRHFILIPDFEECVGFMPDYWINTSEPLIEIAAWIQSPENYQFSYKNSFDEFLKNKAKTSDLVFPDNMKIKLPSTGISKELARFSGQWFGVADGILNSAIVVEEIYKNCEADVIYAWGTAPVWHINESGWRRFRGKIENETLILNDNFQGLTITLKILPDGKMEEIYRRPGIYSKEILTKIQNQ